LIFFSPILLFPYKQRELPRIALFFTATTVLNTFLYSLILEEMKTLALSFLALVESRPMVLRRYPSVADPVSELEAPAEVNF